MENKKIQWHPGFVAAMNLELAGNRDDLIFEKEYNLNTKPLEIDLLVIKKYASIQIENEIGRLFRGHNIMEYKSPDDHMDIDTLFKTVAYACLYKSYGKTVNAIKKEDVTISIVREAKPAGLLRYFAESGIAVSKTASGIYYIPADFLFPLQMIVTRELDKNEHAWLRALSEKMEKRDMRELLENINQLTEKFDKELADSVLQISIQANKNIVEELKGEDTMCQALLDIMEPELREIKQKLRMEALQEGHAEGLAKGLVEGRAEGRAEGRKEGIRHMIDTLRGLGHNDAEITEALVRQYNLSPEEMNSYL